MKWLDIRTICFAFSSSFSEKRLSEMDNLVIILAYAATSCCCCCSCCWQYPTFPYDRNMMNGAKRACDNL